MEKSKNLSEVMLKTGLNADELLQIIIKESKLQVTAMLQLKKERDAETEEIESANRYMLAKINNEQIKEQFGKMFNPKSDIVVPTNKIILP
jgi:hypothetical protein